MAKRKRKVYEFKPDRQETGLLKQLYLTRLQRKQLLKWGCLSALCVLMLVVQDVLMSRLRFFGATTDLVVCIIFLIGLYEGTENGSLFAIPVRKDTGERLDLLAISLSDRFTVPYSSKMGIKSEMDKHRVFVRMPIRLPGH